MMAQSTSNMGSYSTSSLKVEQKEPELVEPEIRETNMESDEGDGVDSTGVEAGESEMMGHSNHGGNLLAGKSIPRGGKDPLFLSDVTGLI